MRGTLLPTKKNKDPPPGAAASASAACHRGYHRGRPAAARCVVLFLLFFNVVPVSVTATAVSLPVQHDHDDDSDNDREQAIMMLRGHRHHHHHPGDDDEHGDDDDEHTRMIHGIRHQHDHRDPHHSHHHSFDYDDEDDKEDQEGTAVLGHHDHQHSHDGGGGGCRHHPPHPGGTEFDILHDDSGGGGGGGEYGESEYDDSEEDEDEDDDDESEEDEALEEERFGGMDLNSSSSSETERDLLLLFGQRRKKKTKKGTKHKGRGPGMTEFRQCGVPHPSDNEIERTYKVLDDWEARSPGRRQRLLDQLQENRRRQRQLLSMGPMLSNDTTSNSTHTTVVKTMIIKVWYHVIRIGDTPQLGAWTLEQARESVRIANSYFVDSPFQFRLVGMTQTVNANWFNCIYQDSYAIELAYKSALRREGGDTLNVYMCDLLNAQRLWGYAYFPTALQQYPVYDGVVLGNPFTKGYTALDAHMTFVHEAGHWLGLYHTWAGTCNPSRGGDAVSDTPAHVNNTWTYPGYRKCFEGVTYNTCPDNVKGVDPGLDPLLNHMNYVDTPCQYAKGYFTDGQMVNMVSKFETYRWNKTTCRANGIPCRGNAQCCSGTCRVRTKLCL